MCGRYRLTAKERYIRDHFGFEYDLSWAPRWNIAPTQQIPIVRQDNKQPERTFGLVRWGLIPYWTLLANSGLLGRDDPDNDPWTEPLGWWLLGFRPRRQASGTDRLLTRRRSPKAASPGRIGS